MKPQIQLIRQETGETLLSAFIERIVEPTADEPYVTVDYRAFLSSTVRTIKLKNLGHYDGAGYRVKLNQDETRDVLQMLE